VKGTKKAAQRELRKRLNAIDEGRHVDAGKLTVAKYLERWLADYARSAVAPKTYERWSQLLGNHVTPYIGGTMLAKLQPLEIQGVYTKLLTEGRRDGKGGLAPRTVHHVHRALSQALQQAVKWRLLAINPAESVEAPTVEDAEIQVLTQEEIATVLKAAEGTKLYMPVLLAVTTGMRRGEVLGLRWSDVNLDAAELKVEQTLEQTEGSGLRFKAPKTKRSRRAITLPAFTVNALKRHRAEQAEERLALGIGGDSDGLVFTRYDGATVNPRNFSKEFSRMMKATGVGKTTFHGLRHTHITHLLRAGEHVKVVSERAGHASIAITLQIYGHAIPGMQRDLADRMDASLRGVLQNAE
jgi:integrase